MLARDRATRAERAQALRMSRYMRKTPPKAWPTTRDRMHWRETEPLHAEAARTLATAVVAQAVEIDLLDPRSTLAVAAWLLEGDVLPEEGPVSRRRIVPKVLREVEAILAGSVSWRHGRTRVPPDHEPRLVELLRKHRREVEVR